MKKTHFTRKNLIAIALVFFYAVILVIAAMMIDGNSPVFAEDNAIQLAVANLFPLKALDGRVVKGVPCGSVQAYILVILFAIYLLLAVTSVIYEYRLAKFYNEKPTSKKWITTYAITSGICLVLWIGLSLVSQISDKPYPYYIGTSFAFLGESILVSLVIFFILAALVIAVASLISNIRNIDKPFRFNRSVKDELEDAKDALDELNTEKQQSELAAAFGEYASSDKVVQGGSSSSSSSLTGSATTNNETPLKDKDRVFPGLVSIDYANLNPISATSFSDDISLDQLCNRFRNYLAKEEGLYFSIDTIREFISGLAASRLIILQGLSGTGKSSLARYFSEFLGEKSYFEAVQATWRDRTSLLGFYDDFSKTYNETEFLKRLYDFTYRENEINIMVLDELNISRIEYYFADFLSVLEYPKDEWKIKIMQFPYDFEAPSHLEDGVLKIPENTFFIGTANKDESTFTITDKVYDRAITIDFDNRNDSFEVNGDASPISLSYRGLETLFDKAMSDEELQLSNNDLKKFTRLTDFVYETFDLAFGNRILNQIAIMVPVYQACGGNKEDALDFMFARKIISKLEGRFEDYIKQGLLDLTSLIDEIYSKDSFAITRKEIAKFVKRL